eukprot:scaffold141873_cov124-Phaeocystis_antarctica.AAC.2
MRKSLEGTSRGLVRNVRLVRCHDHKRWLRTSPGHEVGGEVKDLVRARRCRVGRTIEASVVVEAVLLRHGPPRVVD